MTNPPESFGKILKKILDNRGIKYKDFADKIGIRAASVSDWTTEKASPRAESIVKIAQALELTPNQLLGFDEPSNPNQSLIKALSDYQSQIEDLKSRSLDIPSTPEKMALLNDFNLFSAKELEFLKFILMECHDKGIDLNNIDSDKALKKIAE